jgi:hypothetical protein
LHLPLSGGERWIGARAQGKTRPLRTLHHLSKVM